MLKNEADSCHIIGEPQSSHYTSESSKSKDNSKKSNPRNKWSGKGNGKGKYPTVAEKDTTCYKCGAKGHKSNNPKCPQYSKDAKEANNLSKGKQKEQSAKAVTDENIEEAWNIDDENPDELIEVDQKYLDAGCDMLPQAFIAPLLPPPTAPCYAKLAWWAKRHATQHEHFCKHQKCYWHKGNPFDEKEYKSDVESESSDTVDNFPDSDNGLDESKDSDTDPMLDVTKSEESSSTTEFTQWIAGEFEVSNISGWEDPNWKYEDIIDTLNDNYEYPCCEEAFKATLITDDASHMDIFDSGASVHLMPYKERLEKVQSSRTFVKGYAGMPEECTAIGEMVFTLPPECGGKTIRIKGVLWAPHSNCTLIFLGKLDDAGYSFFDNSGHLKLNN